MTLLIVIITMAQPLVLVVRHLDMSVHIVITLVSIMALAIVHQPLRFELLSVSPTPAFALSWRLLSSEKLDRR